MASYTLLAAERTGVLGWGMESWNILPMKHLQTIGIDTLDNVSRVAEQVRWLGGQRLCSAVLIPSVETFQQKQLEVQAVGLCT